MTSPRAASRLAALLLLAAGAGCSDGAIAGVQGDDPRLAVAKVSIAKAQELYTLALAGDAAGQVYRPLLLRALVDGLQFGAPIHNIPVRIGAENLAFNVIAQDAVMTSGGTVAASATMLLAWRGANAEQILVVASPYGAGADPAAAPIVFYLNADDTPRIAVSGTADIRVDPPGLACVYEQHTPLLGPPGQCREERMSAALSISVAPNGDTSRGTQSIQLARTNVNGVRVTRRAEDAPSLAIVRRVLDR